MSISIIGIVGMPPRYGGFETLVDNLLPSEDISLIYCSSLFYKDKTLRYKNTNLKYLPLHANGIQSIFYDMLAMIHSTLFTKNDLLVLGVSGALLYPIIKIFSKRAIITNIDGLEWRRGKWGSFARLFLKLSEQIAVKYSDKVISDNQAIADYVLKEYKRYSHVIPYGGDHVITKMPAKTTGDYALALCRIEPENNVHIILEAFSRTGQKLKFIGNWENSGYGRELKLKYSGLSNIELIDSVYDLSKLFDYRSHCKFYVHGHSAGGTNPSLVEIMHFSKPVLAFNCVYNRATLEGKGLYFDDVDSLVSLITNQQVFDDGAVMLEIALRRYTWNYVRKQYHTLFTDSKQHTS